MSNPEEANDVEAPSVGDVVTDRRGNNMRMLVVGRPDATQSGYRTGSDEEADSPLLNEIEPNNRYAAYEPVVEVKFLTGEDLDDLDVYAYPAARLKVERTAWED